MDANTGQGPLHGVDDVDWSAKAPERGTEIPGLLRTVASGDGSMEAVSTLYDILRHPGPGYTAAPEAVRFLLRIAGDRGTGAPGEALSLVFELVVPVPLSTVPERVEESLWQDEVAWSSATGADEVRAQYLKWRDDAPDEQMFRRMSARYDAACRDRGTELLDAELAVHTAVRENLSELLGLMEGMDNRTGLNSTAEWVASILAFFPEARDEIVPRILRRRDMLEPREDTGSPLAAAAASRESWRKPQSAELFALGMLASPDDADTTVALAREMGGGNLYNAFAASAALAVIHGERAPEEAVERMRRSGRTRVGFTSLFNDSWPHPGEVEPVVLGYLALGRGGAATAELRTEMLPDVVKSAGPATPAVVGAALESVLGPRAEPEDAAEAVESAATGDEDSDPAPVLQVLWAIAEVPASTWDDTSLGDTVAAWHLPSARADFRAYAGVDDPAEEAEDTEEPTAAEGAAPAASNTPAEQRGLFGRLFGGR